MKVRELIKALQEADPTGECDVVTNTTPSWVIRNDVGKLSMIAGADKMKGPYMGPCMSKRDTDTYVIRDTKDKVVLDVLHLETVMHNNPGIFVYIEGGDSVSETFLEERVNELRQKCVKYRTRVCDFTKRINKQFKGNNDD